MPTPRCAAAGSRLAVGSSASIRARLAAAASVPWPPSGVRRPTAGRRVRRRAPPGPLVPAPRGLHRLQAAGTSAASCASAPARAARPRQPTRCSPAQSAAPTRCRPCSSWPCARPQSAQLAAAAAAAWCHAPARALGAALAGMKPARQRSRVDLPAPLGPITATRSPRQLAGAAGSAARRPSAATCSPSTKTAPHRHRCVTARPAACARSARRTPTTSSHHDDQQRGQPAPLKQRGRFGDQQAQAAGADQAQDRRVADVEFPDIQMAATRTAAAPPARRRGRRPAPGPAPVARTASTAAMSSDLDGLGEQLAVGAHRVQARWPGCRPSARDRRCRPAAGRRPACGWRAARRAAPRRSHGQRHGGACRLRAASRASGRASSGAEQRAQGGDLQVVQVARASGRQEAAPRPRAGSPRAAAVPSSLRYSSRSGPNQTSRKLGRGEVAPAVCTRLCQGWRPSVRSPAAAQRGQAQHRPAPRRPGPGRSQPAGRALGAGAGSALRQPFTATAACRSPARRRGWACRSRCRRRRSRCSCGGRSVGLVFSAAPISSSAALQLVDAAPRPWPALALTAKASLGSGSPTAR